MDWVKIASEIIIPVIGLVLTVLVAPRLRAWLAKKAETQTEANWQQLAKTAVEAAQQLFGASSGDAIANQSKYRYAVSYLTAAGVDECDAQRLVESAVWQLKQVTAAISAPAGEADANE